MRQLVAELRGTVTQAVPRAVTVCMTPVVEAPDQPVLTQFEADYYLRRYADPEQS